MPRYTINTDEDRWSMEHYDDETRLAASSRLQIRGHFNLPYDICGLRHRIARPVNRYRPCLLPHRHEQLAHGNWGHRTGLSQGQLDRMTELWATNSAMDWPEIVNNVFTNRRRTPRQRNPVERHIDRAVDNLNRENIEAAATEIEEGFVETCMSCGHRKQLPFMFEGVGGICGACYIGGTTPPNEPCAFFHEEHGFCIAAKEHDATTHSFKVQSEPESDLWLI